MNHDISTAAQCYLGFVDGQLAAFTSIIHFPHPKFKNGKRIHRTVVLPDYQGLGLGVLINNIVAEKYKQDGFRVMMTTSHPAFCNALQKSPLWILKNQGRNQKIRSSLLATSLNKSISSNRRTTSWLYVGNKINPATKDG